ncbi:phage late control D family protein [Leptospira sp. 96542]|nr:phage late control D family protein [Leptospira sp. 96542]
MATLPTALSALTAPVKTPDYRLTLDGRNITPTIGARLNSLTLREDRGGTADQLDLTLNDEDGLLELPRKGVLITLAIGWKDGQLVDKGSYTVDEVSHSGAPDVVILRARSADVGQSLQLRREQSWHALPLGDIIKTIAARNKLAARIDPTLAARTVAHIDQTGESDMAFLTRLAKDYDAVATVKAGALLLLPINATRTSAGQALPALTITRADGDQHNYTTADRESYTGVRAYWHDGKAAKRKGVLVGSTQNEKLLTKTTFPTETAAREAAQAEWNRIQRGMATLTLTLAEGLPLLGPQTPVRVQGFKPEIDADGWLCVNVTHTLNDGGWTTQTELELAQ